MKLVDAVQKHFLEVFSSLSRPAAEHDLELPRVVDGLMSQLVECKASAPLIALALAVYTHKGAALTILRLVA